MNNDQLQPYDFAAAARVKLPLRRKLKTWFHKTCELLQDQWAMVSQTPITASLESLDAQPFSSVLKTWKNSCSSTTVSFSGDVLSGMLVFENQQLRILILDILGGCDEEPSDQPLTSIEVSMAVIIFEMAAAAFSESWIKQEPLDVAIGEFDAMPNRSRAYAADEDTLVCVLSIRVGEHLAQLQLVLPHDHTKSMVGIESATEAGKQKVKPVSSEKISGIQVELVASLGKVEVDMSELTQLAEGDIVVFDQPVNEPINVIANGQDLFSAWPGRQFAQQSLRLNSFLEN